MGHDQLRVDVYDTPVKPAVAAKRGGPCEWCRFRMPWKCTGVSCWGCTCPCQDRKHGRGGPSNAGGTE